MTDANDFSVMEWLLPYGWVIVVVGLAILMCWWLGVFHQFKVNNDNIQKEYAWCEAQGMHGAGLMEGMCSFENCTTNLAGVSTCNKQFIDIPTSKGSEGMK